MAKGIERVDGRKEGIKGNWTPPKQAFIFLVFGTKNTYPSLSFVQMQHLHGRFYGIA
jgi:hypothetical protein